MIEAHVIEAHVIEAHVIEAHVIEAHVIEAHVIEAHVIEAHVIEAHVIEAHVIEAHGTSKKRWCGFCNPAPSFFISVDYWVLGCSAAAEFSVSRALKSAVTRL